jgi:hypothetical protein
MSLRKSFLSREKSKDEISDFFIVFYLTMIAIIEGVAFILLIENTFHAIMDSHGHLIKDMLLKIIPYSVVSFMILILITYQYVLFLLSFRWEVRIWDIVMPFVMGILQSSQTYFFHDPEIWWTMGILITLAGILSLYSTKKMVRHSLIENLDKTYLTRSVNRFIYNSWIAAGVMGLIVFILNKDFLEVKYQEVLLFFPVCSVLFIFRQLTIDHRKSFKQHKA